MANNKLARRSGWSPGVFGFNVEQPLPMMIRFSGGTVASLVLCISVVVSATAGELASYRKLQVSDQFFSEGANFGDFNHDGVMDAVSGPYWYEGPDFKTRHEIYPAAPYDPLHYSENFFAFTHDFNGDG